MQMLFLVDCVWDAWVNGTCSTTCGAGKQTNMRVKLTVEAYGGTCTENSTEVVSCLDVECPGMYFSMTFDLKTPRLRLTYTTKMYIHKNIYLITVDCVWDAWVNGTCSTTCGAGQQTNTRLKLTQEAYGGVCTEDSTEVVPCMNVECPGMYLSRTFD